MSSSELLPPRRPGRDGHRPSRPRAGGRLRAAVGVVAGGIVVAGTAGAVVAGGLTASHHGPASDQSSAQAQSTSQSTSQSTGGGTAQSVSGAALPKDPEQVLGGARVPGLPTVQRLRHDDVDFTVTVAPARPGPNLVRVDSVGISHGEIADSHAEHSGHAEGAGHESHTIFVGTVDQSHAGTMVKAKPRPGVGGLWAVVDLPAGSNPLLISHGDHRIPFVVDTGDQPADASATRAWTGPDGPECLAAATASELAGAVPAKACPAQTLPNADRTQLIAEVDTLARRGVEEIAVRHDDSPRSRAAYALVQQTAAAHGVSVVDPEATPGERDALLVVSGWADAASSLAQVSSTPIRRQPIRSDGTWLAPWLLSPGVVDSTAGAVLALDFDIRDRAAQDYSQALTKYFPGQSPTASGYQAWRAAHGAGPSPLTLYAASRAAYMPASAGHASHESSVAWFPGGTVTPVGSLGDLS